MTLTDAGVALWQVKGKIKEPEFELPPGASPQYAKALRKKARLGAKKDALQVRGLCSCHSHVVRKKAAASHNLTLCRATLQQGLSGRPEGSEPLLQVGVEFKMSYSTCGQL
jgi:hypothetical protein